MENDIPEALVKKYFLGSRYNVSFLLYAHATTTPAGYENPSPVKTSYARKLNICKGVHPTDDDIGLYSMSWLVPELNQARKLSSKFSGDAMFFNLCYLSAKWEGLGTQISTKKNEDEFYAAFARSLK